MIEQDLTSENTKRTIKEGGSVTCWTCKSTNVLKKLPSSFTISDLSIGLFSQRHGVDWILIWSPRTSLAARRGYRWWLQSCRYALWPQPNLSLSRFSLASGHRSDREDSQQRIGSGVIIKGSRRWKPGMINNVFIRTSDCHRRCWFINSPRRMLTR